MAADQPDSEPKSEFYPSYAEFSKTLRTWFVAFGIGGPIVLLTNEKIGPIIVASGCSFDIGILFLMGGGIQVVSSFFNKHAMWHMYFAEDEKDSDTVKKQDENVKGERAYKSHHKNTLTYKFSCWYSYQNWIDELLDFFTLVVFAWATMLAFVILTSPPGKVICDHEKSRLAWITGLMTATVIIAIWQYVGRRSPSESKT